MSTTTMRRTALAGGIFYLLTFVSIPALPLYGAALEDADFVLGAGSDAGVPWGAFLEIVVGLACIGTAVSLYPVTKRYSERAALGFVTARVLEASMIFAGVTSVLALQLVRDDAVGATGSDAASLLAVGQALDRVRDAVFLLGPGFIPVVNALCLATVLHRSGLVPRIIPTVGLIGAPLLLASSTATLFGLHDQVSTTALLGALPIALWELSLGFWLTFKGFAPTAAAAVADTPAAVPTAA